MDQLIFASLSHTHYWYEVGMLKVYGGIHERLSCNSMLLKSITLERGDISYYRIIRLITIQVKC